MPLARPSPTPPTSFDDRAAKVDGIFSQWNKSDSPGCSVAIIQNDRIIYERGYGSANLELSIPIKPTTVFNVGSISKQFTAMSILMLARDRKLSLDEDVRKYVPEMSNIKDPITIRNLINHTSGLRDFLEMLEMAGWRTGDVRTEKDVLDMVSRQRTLNHKPGDEYVYSNTGYVLLAIIVKRVSGQTLEDFADANIFKPLGMNHTRFVADHRIVIPGVADAYLPDEKFGFVKWMPQDDIIGSSDLFTTVEDLALWDRNFYHRKVGGDAVIRQMTEPGKLNDGSRLNYGGGLFTGTYRGVSSVFHSGSTLGYQGTLHRFPDQHFSVGLLCNVRGVNPDSLARQIADIYLSDSFAQSLNTPPPPIVTAPENALKLTQKDLSRFEGLYWNPVVDNVRRVYVKGARLMYFRTPGNETELVPISPNRFLMTGIRSHTEIGFNFGKNGEPVEMTFYETDRKPVTQEYVKPANYSPQQLAEFAGRYYSAELNATYSIEPKGDKLLIHTGNWGDFLLSARFLDSFANTDEMGTITFTRGLKNSPDGFILRSGKVRNLRFEKVGSATAGSGVRDIG